MEIIKSLEHKFHEYTNGTNKKVVGNEFIRGVRPFVSFVFKCFVLIMYTVVLHQSAMGAELECKECHQKIYYEISSSAYQHSNFVQRECNVCHISSERTTGLSIDGSHGKIILKSGKGAGIDACLERCHRQGASHPVGVTSKGNIRIPNSLPTAEGNIMTCVTCHTPHGGKAKYLARIDFKRDICVLCHLDKL